MRNYDVQVNGKQFSVSLISRKGSNVEFKVADETYSVEVIPVFEQKKGNGGPALVNQGSNGEIKAPMPGIIVSVPKAVGSKVNAGETVIVIEAMKMENNIPSPKTGIIKAVHVKPSQEVNSGQILISIE